ncbi:hypothetical protein ABLN97_00625 [Mycobacterium tuberculosis]
MPNTLLPTSPLSSRLTAAATPGWLEWFINRYLPISQLFYNTVVCHISLVLANVPYYIVAGAGMDRSRGRRAGRRGAGGRRRRGYRPNPYPRV